MEREKTIAAYTLGCKVNQYDTEAMLDLMNDYPSYSGKSEGMTGVTAFVIHTEAVEAPEEDEGEKF